MRDVLVVEDDRVVLDAVAGLCRSEGLQVDEAADVEAAVDKLSLERYRLALVDLMLPTGSGFDLLRDAHVAQRASSVVTISGYATTDNALRSFQLGAFDFLPKPFDVAELLGVVRRSLRYGERSADRDAAGEVPVEPRLFLGRHSWAAPDVDGTATIGAAETFSGVLGEVERIELPRVKEHLNQGQRVARLEGAEEVHRIWSPLSGRVVAANTRLAAAVDLLDRSPFSHGWLARIVPADLESERLVLAARAIGERGSAEGG